jgi:hypothetical protein
LRSIHRLRGRFIKTARTIRKLTLALIRQPSLVYPLGSLTPHQGRASPRFSEIRMKTTSAAIRALRTVALFATGEASFSPRSTLATFPAYPRLQRAARHMTVRACVDPAPVSINPTNPAPILLAGDV